MSLAPGTRLGPYEILGPLGAGGMGEVWRARDTRLGREVAVKVLPEAFARDPERLARFERETRAVAALSHPNILALHDLGSHEGRSFAVMELLEGETLRARLGQGALPVRRALELAAQIARGLAAAHDRGIVHRDLKPENLWITRDGRVKILDFGLAKQATPAGRAPTSLAPTETVGTGAGVILGTVGYMSPEQVRGIPIDARSDLFSFGAVLYEMLSARRAFAGPTPADTMSAILKEEPPDLTQSVRDLPPAVERIVRRCLEKEPDARFHSAHDLAFALEALSSPSSSGESVPLPARAARRMPARALLGGAAVALAVAGAVALGLSFARRSGERPIPEFRQLSFRRGYVYSARFAPDAQTVLYGGVFSGSPLAVYSTRVDGLESRPLDLPSADVVGISRGGEMALILGRHQVGSWLRVGTLAQASLAGGSPRPILEDVYDADISPDGQRFAVVRPVGSAQQIEYPIGRSLFKVEGWISHPRIAPDGARVAFIVHPHAEDDLGYVAIVGADGRVERLSAENNFAQGLCWSPRGDEVWFSTGENEGGTVRAATPGRRERILLRAPVALRVQDAAPTGQVLVVTDGLHAEIDGRLAGDAHDRIYSWWDDDGLSGLSADGSAMVAQGGIMVGGEYTSYVRRNDGRPPVQLGRGSPIGISPDGRYVLAGTLLTARDTLALLPTGLGQPRMLGLGSIEPIITGLSSLAHFSADGSRFSFIGAEPGHGRRAYIMDIAGGRPERASPEGVVNAILSPDGRTVVAVDAAGRLVQCAGSEVATPVPGARPGEIPLTWAATGRAVLVWDRTLPARVFRLDLDSGRRETLLEIVPDDPSGVLYASLCVTPDGRCYLYRARRSLSDVHVVSRMP